MENCGLCLKPLGEGWCSKCAEAAWKNAEKEPEYCTICGHSLHFEHDHKPDLSGLDDGPRLGRTYTRRAPPKSATEIREIRLRAWETRRQKYGPHGHR